MVAKRKKITKRGEMVATALAAPIDASASKKLDTVFQYHTGELSHLAVSPEVARAVKAGLVRRLVGEAAPLALGMLHRTVQLGWRALDKGEHPTAGQIDSAKTLLGMAGLQAASEEMRLDKDPGEMSGAELEEALRKAEDARAELARRGAIEAEGRVSAPSDAPGDSQDADKAKFLFS